MFERGSFLAVLEWFVRGKASPDLARPQVCSFGAMSSISPSRVHNQFAGRPGGLAVGLSVHLHSGAGHCQQFAGLPLAPMQGGILTGACSCPLPGFPDAVQSLRWPSLSGARALTAGWRCIGPSHHADCGSVIQVTFRVEVTEQMGSSGS